MFRRVEDLFPKPLRDELLRLARLDRNWAVWKFNGKMVTGKSGHQRAEYSIRCRQDTWLRRTWTSGGDGFAMLASSIWLVDGPKVFRPTVDQCRAMEQIEVRLELSEYSQPYPALLIDLPPIYAPFENVLCHHQTDGAEGKLSFTACLHSKNNLDDIVTTVATDGQPMEHSITEFDTDCAEPTTASKVIRVAINSCLALVNFGHYANFLYPKEVVSDQRLACEDTPRGERARDRLQTAPQLVQFDREVVLHRDKVKREAGEPTGREMPFHWVRGHWRMQPYGPQNSQRKRILIRPYMVRADKLFDKDVSDTTTTYRT